MDEPPNIQYRPRLAAICGAALAAALFTPVPATAEVTKAAVRAEAPVRAASVQSLPAPDQLAQSLISTGMIGIGLAMGGLVIVAHRRRQW